MPQKPSYKDLEKRIRELESENRALSESKAIGVSGKPSSRTIETEIGNLLSTDEATRADMAVAIQKLKQEADERLKAESALRQSEEKYRGIFDESVVAIYLFDNEKNFLDSNQAGMELLGYSKEELLGMSIPDVDADPAVVNPAHEQLLGGDRLINYEHQLRKKDGSIITVLNNSRPITNDSGNVIGMQSTLIDITDRKQAEKALRKRESLLTAFTHALPDISFILDEEGKYIEVIASGKLFLYADQKKMLGSYIHDVLPKEIADEILRIIQLTITTNKSQSYEYKLDVPAGETWFHGRTSPMKELIDGKKAIVWLAHDITERIKAQEALYESEAKYRALIETTDTGYLILDKDGKVIDANSEYARLSGHQTIDEIIGRSVAEWTSPHDLERNAQEVKKCFEKGFVRNLVIDYIDKNGKLIPIDINGKVVSTDDGLRILGLCRDITERRLKIKIQEAQLRLIEYSAGHPVIELLQKFLDEAEVLTGSEIGFYHFVEEDQKTLAPQTWSTNTLTNMCTTEGEGLHYPISKAGVWMDCVRKCRPVIHNDYANLPHRKGLPKGHASIVRELVVPVVRGGKIVAILGVGNKKTDYEAHDVEMIQQLADLAWETVVRKRAEEKTKRSERFLDAIIENIPNVLFVKDAKELRFVRFNKASEDLFGHSREEMIGKNDYDFFPRAEADFFTEKDRQTLEARNLIDIPDEPVQTRNKGQRRLHTKKIPILDENGRPEYLLGISEDITDLKQLEKQIRQTQKMEAIGTLAGGIAHDFNNILSSIIGFTELAIDDVKKGTALEENLQEILKAGIRAKELVAQILILSRRDSLEFKPIRVNSVIKEAIKMLRSTIPTSIDIQENICHRPLLSKII